MQARGQFGCTFWPQTNALRVYCLASLHKLRALSSYSVALNLSRRMDDDQHAASTSVPTINSTIHVGFICKYSGLSWNTQSECNPLTSSPVQATSLSIGIDYYSLGPESRSIWKSRIQIGRFEQLASCK